MKRIDRKNYTLRVSPFVGFAAYIFLLAQYGFYLHLATRDFFLWAKGIILAILLMVYIMFIIKEPDLRCFVRENK